MAKKSFKNTTIDQLARMVQKGFNDLRSEMNKRFDELTDEMNSRFNEIERRLDRLEKMVYDEQHERMIRLEDRVQKVEADFRALLSGKNK